MSKELKYKRFEVKEFDAETGKISGYGSVFGNKDSYGDIVQPTAFKNLEEKGIKRIKMLWQHNMKEPLGVWDSYKIDDHGLWLEGTISQVVQRGKEAIDLIKMGAIDGLSIGYYTMKETWDSATKSLLLDEVDLIETSIVTMPANTLARISEIKSKSDKIQTIRHIENLLRDAGYSRKDSQAILHGELFKAEQSERDAGEIKSISNELDKLITNIKG
jgi:HK97 family phage prohead protease